MATVDTPYVKLTKTPLAQQTSVCGTPVRPLSIVMASFAVVVIAGTHILFGVLIFGLKAEFAAKLSTKDDSREDGPGDYKTPWYSALKKSKGHKSYSNAMDETQRSNYAYNAAGGCSIGSGILLVITGIILLVGAIKIRPQLFYPWFISMIVAIGFGRIVPIFCSFVIENKYLVFVIIMLFVDLISIIILFFCWGQMAGLQRNKRYMKNDQHAFLNKPGVKDEPFSALTPGSYPQQV